MLPHIIGFFSWRNFVIYIHTCWFSNLFSKLVWWVPICCKTKRTGQDCRTSGASISSYQFLRCGTKWRRTAAVLTRATGRTTMRWSVSWIKTRWAGTSLSIGLRTAAAAAAAAVIRIRWGVQATNPTIATSRRSSRRD